MIIENVLLIFSLLTFGAQMGSFFLGLLFYLSRKELWKLKGILFLGYLVILYFLAILRYYTGTVLQKEDSLVLLMVKALEMTGISLLIYYFSATINYFMKRQWRLGKLIWVIVAVIATFSLGVMSLVLGNSLLLHLLLSLILILSMIIISIDALRSLPLIQRPTDRVSITLLSALTLLFLPLVLTSRFLGLYLQDIQVSNMLGFLTSSVYYLGLAVILIRFFLIRQLERDERVLTLAEQPKEYFDEMSITPREKDIILLLEKGLSYKEIGGELNISINTVNNHIANIYKKFSVRSKVELLNALRDNQKDRGVKND